MESINKRTIAKEMVRFCGHEGTENTPIQAEMKKLFQGCITRFEKEKAHVWRNAELTISATDGREHVIAAGKCKYKFVALLDEHDEVEIIKHK